MASFRNSIVASVLLTCLLASEYVIATTSSTSGDHFPCTASYLKLKRDLAVGSRIANVFMSTTSDISARINNTNDVEQIHDTLKSLVNLVKLQRLLNASMPAASDRVTAIKVIFQALANDACTWLRHVLRTNSFDCTESGINQFLSLVEIYGVMTDAALTSRNLCDPGDQPASRCSTGAPSSTA